MRLSVRVWLPLAVGAVLCNGLQGVEAAGLGTIRGFVKDGAGNPLSGAAVLVFATTEEAKAERAIKKATTDEKGKFVASGIVPGRYLVKAEAEGFRPVELAADVVPNKATVFDSILLRRVGTLSEETGLNRDPKYAARTARRTILRHSESGDDPVAAEPEPVALTDSARDMHGYVQLLSQASDSSSAWFGGTNFAFSQQLSREASFVISGQAGFGNGAPQRIEALTTAYAGNRHQLSVALGYGRFTFSRNSAAQLGQFSLSALDRFQVSGPVLVVYGLQVTRFSPGDSATTVLPRFGLAVDATPRTRLFAGLEPGSSRDEQSRVNLESGEIVFADPTAVAFSEEGQPLADRSYRLQVGAQHLLSEDSSIEVMAFFDTVSGHGVGLLAIPLEGGAESELRSVEQRGRSRGVRMVYRRHLNNVLEGSIGYAVGEGQSLSPNGITTPDRLFTNQVFHVFSAKIDANMVRTGTRVSTVLRIAPQRALFAIDPFQGQLTSYDPNFSVSLTQELPRLAFLPGQWQALVELRNLLDQQPSVTDEGQELIASRHHRLVRVGLSLRF